MQTTTNLRTAGSSRARLLDRLHATLGANVSFPMPMTPMAMLKVQITPLDLGLYQRLLPDGLRMPAQPVLQVEMLEARPGWREASVCVRANLGTEDVWFALYWAIDSWLGYKLGRLVGYPKFMAQSLTVETSSEGARGQVYHRGHSQLAVDLRFDLPGHVRSAEHTSMLDSIRVPEADRDVLLLVPPSLGPSMNRLAFKATIPVRTEQRTGVAHCKLDIDEPFAALFPAQDLAWPARFIERVGVGFGWLLARRVPN